jgi:hypothetical protein
MTGDERVTWKLKSPVRIFGGQRGPDGARREITQLTHMKRQVNRII